MSLLVLHSFSLPTALINYTVVDLVLPQGNSLYTTQDSSAHMQDHKNESNGIQVQYCARINKRLSAMCGYTLLCTRFRRGLDAEINLNHLCMSKLPVQQKCSSF